MLHATDMHFAFLKAANPNTEMGKRILSLIRAHHDMMVKQQADAADAKRKQAERLATPLDAV